MSVRVACVCLLALVGAAADARAQAVTRAFLRADLASPQQADSYINFEASAEGGLTPHEFKWWLWEGVAWRMLRDWNMRPRLTWNPETPGQYMVAIWARSQGSSVNAAQALAQLRYDITPRVPGSIPTIHIFFTRTGDPFYVNNPILLVAWFAQLSYRIDPLVSIPPVTGAMPTLDLPSPAAGHNDYVHRCRNRRTGSGGIQVAALEWA